MICKWWPDGTNLTLNVQYLSCEMQENTDNTKILGGRSLLEMPYCDIVLNVITPHSYLGKVSNISIYVFFVFLPVV